jgi:transposase-like protein
MVIFEMSASKNGVSAAEIQRKYGICNRSAWFLMHRIREAMAAPYQTMFTGVVLADEAYIGGDPENRHASAYRETDGRGTEKTPVVTIMDQATGEVRSHVVANVDGVTLGRILMGNVDPMGSTLVTDMWKGYNLPGSFFSKHERVNHLSIPRFDGHLH